MSTQIDRWRGTFGNQYTERNIVDPASRKDWFAAHLPEDVKSVLEVGANRGHNILAIDMARPGIFAKGTEPNASARKVALESGIHLEPFDVYTMRANVKFDLVFTSGVLIHVPPVRLSGALRNLYAASRRYVLAVEYRRDDDTMIEYRGYQDMLWAADYGAHYQRLFPDLELLDEGALTESDGFSDAYFWLLRKGASDG